MFFWILKKRKETYVYFTGLLITLPSVISYRKSVPVSHQHQTSCSEIDFEAKIYIDIHVQHGPEWITLWELGIELQ